MVAQMVKNLPAMPETQVQSLGQEDPLEKGMTTHSSILAWSYLSKQALGVPVTKLFVVVMCRAVLSHSVMPNSFDTPWNAAR